MSIINGILAFIEAVPIIEKWFQRLMDAWVDRQIANHEDRYNERDSQRGAHLDAIKKVKRDLKEGIIDRETAKSKILHYRMLLAKLGK